MTETERANFGHLVGDIAWFGVAFPATSRFLSIYAIRLGASAMLLGWISALPAIIMMLMSSLAPWWRRKHPDTIQSLLWPGIGFRLVFLLPAFTAFFPADWQPGWLLVAVTVPALAQGFSSVMFLILLREAVDRTVLTALMSRRSLVFNVTVGLSTLGMGLWLDHAPFPSNYQFMYLAAFAASLVSLWHIQKTRVIAAEPLPDVDHPPIRPWRSPEFMHMAFITVVTHIALFVLIPIIPLRLVKELGANEGFMSLFALAELSSAAGIALVTNRLIRHHGTRRVIALGMIGTALAAGILALADNLYVTLIGGALGGATWTAAALGLFRFFSESTPSENLTAYSTLYNQIVALSIFTGPMIGSQLASTSLSLTTVLWIGVALRLVSGLIVSFDVRGRPRRMRRPEPAAGGA